MTHPLEQIARIALEANPIAYQGVRKIINGMTWNASYIFRRDDPVSFGDLGYGANKFKQLQRNYVNEEEFARVRAVLDRRKHQSFTSVALSMRGKPKGTRSMGHCILSVVVTRTKKEERVEVQYRSTELTLKFGGDLAFLPWVFEQIGIDRRSPVTFRFANCYISGVYLPYLVKFVADPIKLLRDIEVCDPIFFEHASRFFLRSAMQRDQFFPYSPENVAHKFGWSHIEDSTMRSIREHLTKRHRRFGPLGWAKVHHVKGEYIPRAKRNLEDEE